MSKTHKIKTTMPFFQEVQDGKKPYDYRLNDRNYQVGDQLHHIEWDAKEQKETGRQCWTTIVNKLDGGIFGIPDGYCILTQHTSALTDFARDYARIDHLLKDYENKLSYRMGSDMSERIAHVLNQFNSVAVESAWKGKNFLDDVKTQFKAIEITLEGLTSEAYNHGQKRVIANHIINILRSNIDRIDRVQWDYSNRLYENVNYFRSESPEGDLMKRYKLLKDEHERLKNNINTMKEKLPSELKDDLPF